ncbi:hypothetical protein [Frankia sp. CiP1_Cm_nod2]|uniref:hypothetical protein n=1 Tax=Frankia sp. CiP1_Cm_nod2 TaxID=2897161 RepID=UPI002024AB40
MVAIDRPWLRVPIGPEAASWSTVTASRTVLVVAHTVTSTNRLLDVLPALTADTRVQVVFTTTGTSPFNDGVVDLLAGIGARTVP